MKTCSKCGKTGPDDQFYRGQCKQCKAAKDKTYRRNPEAIKRCHQRLSLTRKSIRAEKRKLLPPKPPPLKSLNYEEKKARFRANYYLYRDKILKYHRKYSKSHPEQNRKHARNWVRRHPDKVAFLNHQSRIFRYGLIAKGDKFKPSEIYKRDNWRCHICGFKVSKKQLSIDHLVPVSKGGEHTRQNVATAHRSCNSSRGAGRIPAQLFLIA